MPGAREIPTAPRVSRCPPGTVPPGDSRSMRKRTDVYEFALIYRLGTFVITPSGWSAPAVSAGGRIPTSSSRATRTRRSAVASSRRGSGLSCIAGPTTTKPIASAPVAGALGARAPKRCSDGAARSPRCSGCADGCPSAPPHPRQPDPALRRVQDSERRRPHHPRLPGTRGSMYMLERRLARTGSSSCRSTRDVERRTSAVGVLIHRKIERIWRNAVAAARHHRPLDGRPDRAYYVEARRPPRFASSS